MDSDKMASRQTLIRILVESNWVLKKEIFNGIFETRDILIHDSFQTKLINHLINELLLHPGVAEYIAPVGGPGSDIIENFRQ